MEKFRVTVKQMYGKKDLLREKKQRAGETISENIIVVVFITYYCY